jgi:hypothetical protein
MNTIHILCVYTLLFRAVQETRRKVDQMCKTLQVVTWRVFWYRRLEIISLLFLQHRINSLHIHLNPLNAELNPICHLLVLLGDLKFMGPCNVSIFQYTCISNKMQHYTLYLCLETALHVSGGNSTNRQERIQLYLQHMVFVTPLLLSAAIVEELEQVWVCCGWRTPPTAHSNRFQLFHDNGR